MQLAEGFRARLDFQGLPDVWIGWCLLRLVEAPSALAPHQLRVTAGSGPVTARSSSDSVRPILLKDSLSRANQEILCS